MDPHPENDVSSWLVSYNNYLRDVVGTAATTRVRYSRVVRRFVGIYLLGGRHRLGQIVGSTGDGVRPGGNRFEEGCGRSAPMSAVRSFLRFLTWRGIVLPKPSTFADIARMNRDFRKHSSHQRWSRQC
jgi:hypothetical protein